MKHYEKLDYNPDNLAKALNNDFITKEKLTTDHFHFRYLLDYLGDKEPDALAARTIIIEKNYVSRSYINDYSAFYSLCFNDNYTRKSNRVHFFSNEFTNEEFELDILSEDNKVINNDTYLGYIVVKNLPSVIIGATLLRTYRNNSSRFYVTRNSSISLFGKQLNIDTLAFQEQDKVVSACATSALWMAFYKTSCYFQTHLPTPSEITSSAKNTFKFSGRTFPNKEGLDHSQIGNAIENVGLEFELRNQKGLEDPQTVKSFVYSYCKLGLPVLLGIYIKGKGRHLITISGFRNEIKNENKWNKTNVSLVSYGINLFYAHDDRIGPYSRLKIHDKPREDGKIVETAWWIDKTGSKKYQAKVTSIIVPIYKKIRISFEDIFNEVRHFDYLFKSKLGKRFNITWDIYLNSSNDYKKEILDNEDLDGDFKKKLVFVQLPKFIWISRLIIDDATVFEMIHDSTDIPSGHFCQMLNCYDAGFLLTINNELQNNDFRNHILSELNISYLTLLEGLGEDAPASYYKPIDYLTNP